MNSSTTTSQLEQVWQTKRNAAYVTVLWSILVAISLAWNVQHQREELWVNAHLQADAYINKDLSFRNWATSHGGVYVKPTEDSPPNPYLKVPDRDVVTTDGVKLTLINPAYMMRQVLEGFSEPYGLSGHITSLKLLNPHNAPDPWEAEALQAFDRGATEMQTVVELGGKSFYRHMRPIHVKEGCLKCHGDMGYKVGEVRGGISTTMDMGPLEHASAQTIRGMMITHGLVWLVGLAGIVVTTRRFALRAIERERSMEAIRRNEQRALALLSLDDKADKLDEKMLLQEGLEEAERLTASQIAYLHFINDDQQSIELVTWSKQTLKQCQIVSDAHYPLMKAGVWADCARTRQPVMHNDYQNLDNKRGYPQGHSHVQRHLSVPVLEDDKVRLIMGVGNKLDDYDQSDVRLLQMIANDLWKVVRRRRGEAALKRAKEEMEQHVQERTEALSVANEHLSKSLAELGLHHREMKQINRLNDMLQTCHTLEEAYRVIEINLREIFSSAGGVLTAMDAAHLYLEVVASWGNTLCSNSFVLDDCWAMRQGHTHCFRGEGSDLLCKHFVSSPSDGYLCMPLIAQGEIMGLLHLQMKSGDTAEFCEAQRSLAETVCESIKLGLSNISLRIALREQATHDPLTGLYNRRYLDETLPREIYRAVRTREPLCAVMMDIDLFKRFNDTNGHEAGDLVLREIGRLLRANLRKSDIAVRYGGEEITIIMPGSALEDARLRVEQICRQVKELEIQMGEIRLERVTLSAGVAQLPIGGETMDQLLRSADQALYEAKLAGRDRVVVSCPA